MAIEKLTGTDNYDSWATKLKRYFAVFDILEYINLPLDAIQDTDRVKNQLDAAVLLSIHTNISLSLQQVVTNKVHAYDAWETLRRLYTGNTVQELINICGKLHELTFKLNLPVTTFFADVEAAAIKLHRIGYTAPEKLKCTYVLYKIYKKLPATAASITALPDEQITMKYIQEKVIKAVELMQTSSCTHYDNGDPRPRSSSWSSRPAVTYERRLAIMDGREIERKMTIAEGKYGSRPFSTTKCARCFATDHNVEECPRPDNRKCHSSGLVGHIARNCPDFITKSKKINVVIMNTHILGPIFDMGAAVSLVPNKKYLTELSQEPTDETVLLTDGTRLPLIAKGTLKLKWHDGNRLTLTDVYVAPGATDIIISATHLLNINKLKCELTHNSAFIRSERPEDTIHHKLDLTSGVLRLSPCTIDIGDAVETGPGTTSSGRRIVYESENTVTRNRKVQLNEEHVNVPVTPAMAPANNNNHTSVISNKKSILINKTADKTESNLDRENSCTIGKTSPGVQNAIIWHRRLGHPNYKTMRIANRYVYGTGRFTNPETLCETCMEAKFTRKSFNENRTRAGRPGYKTHADLIGPLNPAAIVTQGKYVLTVVDDFSRYATTYVMKTKRETTDRLVNYFKYLKTMFPEPGRIARLRTDGGMEFVNSRLKKFLGEQGITLELAETEAHQHNGTAERFNRTLQNRIRALLIDSGYPVTFWGWASDAATYLYNRTPHTANDNYTPYERFHNKRPNVKYLRMFGARVYTLLPRVRKLDRRAGKRYILGYTDTGYEDTDTDSDDNVSAYSLELDSKITLDGTGGEGDMDGTWEQPVATSTQTVNTIIRREEDEDLSKVERIPRNFKEANSVEFAGKWVPAITRELNAMAEHHVWEIVQRPKECRTLPCAWKFSVKCDGTAKARLYLVGNREPYDSFQNTYAPVTDTMTVFWLCSVAVKNRVTVYQMDVSTAFLNAELDYPRYMRLPDGVELDKNKYTCKLNKAIYGLRISPRRWYMTIETTLKEFGLRQSRHEPCLFYRVTTSGFTLLTMYVDDLLVTGTDAEYVQELRERIRSTYTIKDLGEIKRFLGMDFKREANNGTMYIAQTDYITEIIKTAKLTEANAKPTPMARFGNFPTVKEEDYLPNVTEYKATFTHGQFTGFGQWSK